MDNASSMINNEYDYSNIVPTAEAVSYLVQYCDQINKQLTKLVDADEEKNKELKSDYKEYTFKKSYSQSFEVNIRSKSIGMTDCKDYNQFKSMVDSGSLKDVSWLVVRLNLNFKRGIGNRLDEHTNSFVISFKPYEIKFVRKSNHKDQNMDQIEQQINNILKKFSVVNSIFCTK